MPQSHLDNRIHYRRRKSYNTRSNKIRRVRTPGNRLVVQYRDKVVSVPRNPKHLGGKRLPGIKAMTANERRICKTSYKKVKRAYGGVLSHDLVRDRIVRAFLIEEQKIVKQVLKMKKK